MKMGARNLPLPKELQKRLCPSRANGPLFFGVRAMSYRVAQRWANRYGREVRWLDPDSGSWNGVYGGYMPLQRSVRPSFKVETPKSL